MSRHQLSDTERRWRRNPVDFIEHNCVDPETGAPFCLYPEQIEFLRHAFELDHAGRLKHSEQVFSAGKKSGKSTLAGLMVIFTAVVLAGIGGEINLLANDLEQSQSRVFKIVALILRASPRLRDSVDITANKITLRSTGTAINAWANDYRGFSGGNPTLNVYDESAYYTSESSHRLWDEGVPSPARKISFRLSVSTAGFDGESSPLRDLYDRAMEHGQEIAPDLYRHSNLLCYWTHEMKAPWQRPEWAAEMQRTLRPAQYLRLIRNQWTSSESSFIELPEWDAVVNPSLKPVLANSDLPVWVGLDLGLRHDATALAAVSWDGDRIRLVTHQIFVPREGQTLDIEATAQRSILSLGARFALQCIAFDPWQFLGPSQILARQGIVMQELPQTTGNLTSMATNLLDLIKRRRFVAYPADDLRQAVSKTIAIESSRGWRLGKAKASDRVDPIIALAMAALVCVEAGSPVLSEADRQYWQAASQMLHAQAQAAKASLLPRVASASRDLCGGLRIVDGEYDCKYRELPPDESDYRPRGRCRFGPGAW
jgi:phage terminase large subunit-like protein